MPSLQPDYHLSFSTCLSSTPQIRLSLFPESSSTPLEGPPWSSPHRVSSITKVKLKPQLTWTTPESAHRHGTPAPLVLTIMLCCLEGWRLNNFLSVFHFPSNVLKASSAWEVCTLVLSIHTLLTMSWWLHNSHLMSIEWTHLSGRKINEMTCHYEQQL